MNYLQVNQCEGEELIEYGREGKGEGEGEGEGEKAVVQPPPLETDTSISSGFSSGSDHSGIA